MNFKPFMRLLCHQKPERCYWMCREPLVVCSRCLGIYVGFLITVIFSLFAFGLFTKTVNFIFAIVLFVPMGVDGVSQLLGRRESNNPLRFLTGYTAGYAVALVFYSLVAKTLAFQTTGTIPNMLSIAPLLFIPAFILIFEKFNDSQLLKRTFNFTAIFTALFMVAAVFFLYAVVLRNFIAA